MVVYPAPRCDGKWLTTGSVGFWGKELLICSVYQFPWWNILTMVGLQANSITSLKMEWERDDHKWPLRAGVSNLQHTSHYISIAEPSLHLYNGLTQPKGSRLVCLGCQGLGKRERIVLTYCLALPNCSLEKIYKGAEKESGIRNKQGPLKGVLSVLPELHPCRLGRCSSVDLEEQQQSLYPARWQRTFFFFPYGRGKEREH